MKNNAEKINNASEIYLNGEEKSIIRKSLSDFISAHPAPSPYINRFMFWTREKKYLVPTALGIVLLLGVGASALAGNTLPGDVLYPIKINVNEKLESMLATTPKAVAQVGITQAVRRLTEAEALQSKGELSTSTAIEINNSFNNDITLINKQISKLESRGATSSAVEIKNQFQSRFDKYSQIYLHIYEKGNVHGDESTTTEPSSIKKQERGESRNALKPKGVNNAGDNNYILINVGSSTDNTADSLTATSTGQSPMIPATEYERDDKTSVPDSGSSTSKDRTFREGENGGGSYGHENGIND